MGVGPWDPERSEESDTGVSVYIFVCVHSSLHIVCRDNHAILP